MGREKIEAHWVKPGTKIKLSQIDPSDSGGIEKDRAGELLAKEKERISSLQDRLYGENTRALLVVLQGIDTSGKDGTIKSVFTAVSPVGCQVTCFGAPSEEERDHDYLWRIYRNLPRRGNVGVFNRSHYEEVLVARVRKLVPEAVWKERFRQINDFEALITELGTNVIKIFLHIDRAEQKKRLEERLGDPAKNWKYQAGDLDDRALWDDYMTAYEDALSRCSTRAAPWYIVPANKKWYRNLLVAKTVADALESMDPKMPKGTLDVKKVKIPD